ncbi:MAG TPA: hypothetical protein VHV74_06435 [Pseudonocardiaceae bacterium]|nr:hypothetical protein [Pseudonocardiaceae bacterium]
MAPRGRRRRQQEAEHVFTPDPIPRPSGPPASSAPLHDYFNTRRPGADANYVVLPRSLVEAMPLPWQQHMTYLLSEFHQAFSHVTWPVYRVQPSRHEQLTDLDEEQLAEVGYLVEIDPDGEIVYRDRAGRVVDQPMDTTVLVSCLDPIPPPRPPNSTSPRPGPADGPTTVPPTVQPPMPDTPPRGFTVQQPPAAPGEPFGPTGSRQSDGRWRRERRW